LHRTKVLSSSSLRGKIVGRQENAWKIVASWNTGRNDLFSGYTFRLLNTPISVTTVLATDAAQGLIYLTDEMEGALAAGLDFEIYAGEEAPILATRLLTQTPLHQPLPPFEMRLGSTKGTNALLEGKGATVGLLITEGFADLLAIGTQQRPDIFALNIQKPPLLYQKVIEVRERLDAQGTTLVDLTEAELDRVVSKVLESGLKVWAIAFLHSYMNPRHEQAIRQQLQQNGIRLVSCSSELAPSIKILPRAQTAVVNAYLSEVISSYLDAIQKHLSGNSLRVMTSAGSLVGARYFQPKDSLLSGPSGGVVGAASVARLSGIERILTLDMGGTSTDVARYDGEFDYQYESKVGAAHLFSPSLAIETVAAGGGSICSTDGLKLRVGPESAGAHPGPACYGAGGPLTLTDVNLVLGRLDAQSFGIPLHYEAAEQALSGVLSKLITDTDPSHSWKERWLEGFLQIANEKMAEAIRRISVSKGYNLTDYTLLAFGGAGGQHACRVARLLNMRSILIPYDAGLLSAFGMGQARIERFASRQILQPLPIIEPHIFAIIEELTQEALQLLAMEGFLPDDLEVRLTTLHMRLKGQDHSLEIPFSHPSEIQHQFRQKYESLYGYWTEGRVIELESVKVVASTRQAALRAPEKDFPVYFPEPKRFIPGYFGDQWQSVPVFEWEMLLPGASLSGPSLLVSQNSTTVVEAGWKLFLDGANNALLNPEEHLNDHQTTHTERVPATAELPDAVQLELFTNRFRAIADEMGALLQRTSFSVNVKERLDFSCALLDAKGELVANAPHIPVHLGSLGVCVRMVKKVLSMEKGDVVITNHPGYGGSHLPDITLISPIFWNEQLLGYVANRAHHSEVGGTRPGSMPPDATRLSEEGVVIAPTYLIHQGQAQWTAIEHLLTTSPFPTRALSENLADLNAALASIQAGAQAVLQLADQYGIAQVKYYMQALKNYSAHSIQKSLSLFQKSHFTAEELLDDGSRLAVSIQITPATSGPSFEKTLGKQSIQIDFGGTSPRHAGNLNANPAIVSSAVIYVLRLLVEADIPLNEGIMQQVELIIPNGLLNPHFPKNADDCPAVVGGNTETSQRLVDTLLKALGLVACSQGTMNNLLFGNERFGYYETIGGGAGAGATFNGAHAVHTHMTNTRITDPEILEFRYPVRLERFAIRDNSGGHGAHTGGNGIIREMRFLEPVSLTLLAQHRNTSPYGVAGGNAGLPGEQWIIRRDGRQEKLEGMAGATMAEGDRIVVLTPGGGGFGKKES
jgi:5-oxoprolinase (ATP-hydrolysing)